MFGKWNPQNLFSGYDPVIKEDDLVDLKRKQWLHTKKQKKAKRKARKKRRVRSGMSIWGNLGRRQLNQKEM